MPPLHVLTWQITRSTVLGVFSKDTPWPRKFLALGGLVGSGLRLAAGTSISALGPRPEKPLVLYDFERCPSSRLVREALSMLDLDAEMRPCPKTGARFRPKLEGKGVPMLEDPNAGVTLRGSREIVRHLAARYGTGKPTWRLRLLGLPPIALFTGLTIRLLTGQRGAHPRPSRAPEKPLELWSFESSPWCRMVRFLLCELELPWLLHNVAKDSPKRPAFIALSGKMQVPYLVDPNTGARMFESRAIEAYLEKTYGATSLPER